MQSPNLNYILPPADLVMPQAAQEWMVVAFGGFAVVLGLYSLYLSIRRQSALPVLFLFAGLFTVMLEPVADVMGNAIHPPVGQDNIFTVEGHPIPLHIVLAYFWYFGAAQILLFDRFVAQNITPSFWWKTFFISLVGVVAIEQIPLYYGIWVYYGPHAFKIGLMPVSMVFANVASVMIPALVVYRLMPLLTGWKQLLVLPLVPAAAMAGHAGAGLPSYNSLGLSTDMISPLIVQLGGIATIGFAILLVWVAIKIIYNDIPQTQTAAVRGDPTARKPAHASANPRKQSLPV